MFFVCSDPLAVIGQCLGALAVVNRLQEEAECSLSVLQEHLVNTGKSETKSDETSFTAFVVVPIVARQVLEWFGYWPGCTVRLITSTVCFPPR